MSDWYFGQYGNRSEPIGRHRSGEADWEYHVAIHDDAFDESRRAWVVKGRPDFRLAVSVLFPPTDLRMVTERVKRFNAAAK